MPTDFTILIILWQLSLLQPCVYLTIVGMLLINEQDCFVAIFDFYIDVMKCLNLLVVQFAALSMNSHSSLVILMVSFWFSIFQIFVSSRYISGF